MNKPTKAIPKFANEAQEREFWETHDSTDHLDWSKAKKSEPTNQQNPQVASPIGVKSFPNPTNTQKYRKNDNQIR